MSNSNEIYRSRINNVIDYITTHLDQSMSLEILAGVACFSTFHFHRIFRAVTGETLNQFVNRARNERAARLLRFSGKPLREIAAECGFSSPSTLSRSFREYYHVSPAAYRDGKEIANSKICKELQPLEQYSCSPENGSEIQDFSVSIRQFPERRIGYIRVIDAFRDGVVLSAFETVVNWAKGRGLYDTETFFGMSLDDPEVTPKEKYRYEACLTLPEDFLFRQEDSVQSTTLPACKYATTKVSGDLNRVATSINYLFDTWLISSEYECVAQPGLEVFLDKQNICNWNHFDLEICIPVKPIR